MEGKTKVRVLLDDNVQKAYSKGDKGYIDGYLQGADGTPVIAVVLGRKLVFIKAYALEVI